MADYESRVKITTSSFTLFNEEGVMLKLAYLDDSLSVTFGVAEVINGKRSYPREKRDSIIITAERASALYEDIIMKKVIPAIGKRESYDGGVLLSKRKDSLFSIRVENDEVYGILYKEMDENRQPKSTKIYKFSKVPVIELFNPGTSSFEAKNIHAQFTLFIKFIEAFLLMGSHAGTHSFRSANKYVTDMILNTLKDIAAKMGITVESYSSGYSNNNYQKSSGFDNLPPMNEGITELNSLEGIL